MTGDLVAGRPRLDSWKEIAVYLDRDVRTVQRWQRDAGLPVHHVANGRVRSVFAFADEIDAWLTRDRTPDAGSPTPPHDRPDADVDEPDAAGEPAHDSSETWVHGSPQRSPLTVTWTSDTLRLGTSVWVGAVAVALALAVLAATSAAGRARERSRSRAATLVDSALTLAEREQWPAAASLLNQAVTLAPDWALAHGWLALALLNQDDFTAAARQASRSEFDAALRLASEASSADQLFIGASAALAQEEYAHAADMFAALLEVQPDARWASRMRADALLRLGRYPEAATQLVLMTRHRPGDFRANAEAAEGILQWGSNPEDARAFVDRALEALSPDPEAHRPFDVAFVRLLPAYFAWRDRQWSEASAQAARGWADLMRRSRATRQAGASIAATLFLSLCQPTRAREAIDAIESSERRTMMLAYTALIDDDSVALRAALTTSDPTAGFIGPDAYARAGMPKQARRAVERLQHAVPPARPELLEAELALLAGDDARGLRLIDAITPILIADSIGGAPEGIDPVLVAEALTRTARFEAAVRLLERSTAHTPGYNGFGVAGAPWIRQRISLLRMLTRAGRRTQATRLQEELRGYLSQAEEGCALVAQLRDAGSR